MKHRNKENMLSIKGSNLKNNTVENATSLVSDDTAEVRYNLRHAGSKVQKRKTTQSTTLAIVSKGKPVGSIYSGHTSDEKDKRILKQLQVSNVIQENTLSLKRLRNSSKNETGSDEKNEIYVPDRETLTSQKDKNSKLFCVSKVKTVHQDNRSKKNLPNNDVKHECDATIATLKNAKYNLRKQAKVQKENSFHSILTAPAKKENSFGPQQNLLSSKVKRKIAHEKLVIESKSNLFDNTQSEFQYLAESTTMKHNEKAENINQLTVMDVIEETDSLPCRSLRSNTGKHKIDDKSDSQQVDQADKKGLRILDLNTLHQGNKKCRGRPQNKNRDTGNSSTQKKCVAVVPNVKNSRYNLRKQVSPEIQKNSVSVILSVSATKDNPICNTQQKHLSSSKLDYKEQVFKRPLVSNNTFKSYSNGNKKNINRYENVFSDDSTCPVVRQGKTKQSNRLKMKMYDFDDKSSECLNPVSDFTILRAKNLERTKLSIKRIANSDVKYSNSLSNSNPNNLRYNFRITPVLTKSSSNKNELTGTVKTSSLPAKKGKLLTLTPNPAVKMVHKKSHFTDIKEMTNSSLPKKSLNSSKKSFRDQPMHSVVKHKKKMQSTKLISHKNLNTKAKSRSRKTKSPTIAYLTKSSVAFPENQRTPNILHKKSSIKVNMPASVGMCVDNPAESTLQLNCASTPAPECNSGPEEFEMTIVEAKCEENSQFDITLYDSPDELSPIKKVPDSPCSTASSTSYAAGYNDIFSYDEKTDEYLKSPNVEVEESVLKPKRTYRTPHQFKKYLFKHDIPHFQTDVPGVENDVPRKKTKCRGQILQKYTDNMDTGRAALNNWASEMNKHFGEVEMEDLHVE